MKILDYIEACNMNEQNEREKAKFLCFYLLKENNIEEFSMPIISRAFEQSGYNKPNCSRLKANLISGKNKIFISAQNNKEQFSFIPAVLQKLERDYGNLWEETDTVNSKSEILEESKFCGKRQYLDKLIQQINNTYGNHCYDACAVLMRRVLEILLVLSYQKLGIDSEIRDTAGNGYLMLERIISNAKNNATLNLSRIKTELDVLRKVGNYSAHNITYIAGKKDIDDIKLSYRVLLEELYYKAGLI